MNRKEYLLTMLAEESSKLSQEAIAALQYGLETVTKEMSTHAGRVYDQLNNVLAVISVMQDEEMFATSENYCSSAWNYDLVTKREYQIRELLSLEESRQMLFTEHGKDKTISSLASIKEEYTICRRLLQNLVSLKVVKDEQGETDYYKQNKPHAWQSAIKFLSQETKLTNE